MKILMLINWKIERYGQVPSNKQPPDYIVDKELYWFYRYFKQTPEVDVIDIRSFPLLEKIEKNNLRFYIWQTLRIIPRLNKYDLVVSHGMQSAVVLSLWRKIFKTKAKHIVFDIGAFNSASEKGLALKFMQSTSKSIDGFIYHMSSQYQYYEKFFPWIVDRAKFIRFGADFEFFNNQDKKNVTVCKPYIVCVGYDRCDWQTVAEAHKMLHSDIELYFIGGYCEEFSDIPEIKQFEYMSINELREVICNAEFCVLPLEYVKYSFGQMRLLQQMSLGKCVIVSDVPSIADYVKNGETCLLYKPHDVIDLLRKMKKIIEDDNVRNSISNKAKEFVVNCCNEREMAIEIEKYFHSVLGGK